MTDPPSIPALPPLLPSLLAQETGCIPGLRAKFLLCKGRGRQAPRPRRVGKETECSREDRREGGPAAGGVTSALCHPDTERPGEKPPLTPVLDISKQRAEEVEREKTVTMGQERATGINIAPHSGCSSISVPAVCTLVLSLSPSLALSLSLCQSPEHAGQPSSPAPHP